MARDTIGRTFLVATVLCIVCSVMVSVAAVSLRPIQEENKKLDVKKNILQAAGLLGQKYHSQAAIDKLFSEKVEPVLFNLQTGQPAQDAAVDLATYDPRQAAKSPELSIPVEPPGALPGFARREKFTIIYRVHDDSGQLTQVVLPIYGKGLWSTLYGFIAIDADGTTVGGITFYEHGETPGLGGEVDNPDWKEQWKGKKIFDKNGDIQIRVLKGTVGPNDEMEFHYVDGLSGATITTRGVSNLVRYWLGENGFGPYLATLRQRNMNKHRTTAANLSPGGKNG